MEKVKYIKATDAAEIIADRLGIDIGDLVDIFADIPAAKVKEGQGGREMTEKHGGFAYLHSNCEFIKKNKTGKEITFAVCDICGAEHRSNHGVTYNFNWFGGFVYSRTKLCRSCASSMRPMLCRVSDMISEAEFELKKSKMEQKEADK